MESCKTITRAYYIDNCLTPVINNKINKQRPTSGTTNITFHHDNVRPHVTAMVKSHLKDAQFTIIRHPPYSPDLALSDYWLFDLIKSRLDHHTDFESQKRQITKIMEEIPKEEYKKTFDKWLERMQLYINNKGEYFEHLIK